MPAKFDPLLGKVRVKDIAATSLDGQAGSFYLDRANHTGTQLATTISDLSEAIDDRVNALLATVTGLTKTYDDVGGAMSLTNNLITGLSGGQTILGGTGSGESLTISSTAHATKGVIAIGTTTASGNVVFGSTSVPTGVTAGQVAFTKEIIMTGGAEVRFARTSDGVQVGMIQFDTANNRVQINSNSSAGKVALRANATTVFEIDISGGNTRIGFFATTPAVKQTVTGAKGSNAALGSLLTALAAYGLVTDSSSA